MRRPGHAPPALVSLVAVLGLASAAGCGDLGGHGRLEWERIVVSPADLKQTPVDSPERAFLGWFQALQKGDAWHAAQFYSRKLGVTWSSFAIQREQARYALDGLAPPRILATKVDGRRARVRIRFRSGGRAPNGETHVHDSDSDTFTLVRERGGWKLATNRYLELLARAGVQRGAAGTGNG